MRTHEPCVPTAWNIEYTVNVRISQAGGSRSCMVGVPTWGDWG